MSVSGVDESSNSPENSFKSEEQESPKFGDMSILQHLEELRRRIIYCLIAIMCSFVIAFAFNNYIFKIILYPFGPGFHPVVLDPVERFFNYFKIAMASGLVIASPLVIWQIWMFIAPGLLPHEKRYVLPVIPVILLLFAAGAAFGYFLILPISLRFLLNYGSDVILNQIRLERAVSFVVNICLACGIVFQLPVVVFLFSKVGLITAGFLRRKRKFMIIAIFVLAAVLTPTPDPFTMTLVAAPMLILYEASIIVAGLSRPKLKDIENSAED